MYDLGIIGGVGPEATAEIFRRIITLTDAKCDQEHIKICILNKPQIPDRTNYIINNGQSPLPLILEGINELKNLDVKYFIIPCNTSHIFANQFRQQNDIVFIDMVEKTKEYLKKQHHGARVCILGTQGTAKAMIYGNTHSDEEIEIFYPDKESQDELMHIILSVKANNKPILENRIRLIEIMNEIHCLQGECIFVLACTELSVIMSGESIEKIEYIDAMDVLAINAIIKCGYEVKKTIRGGALAIAASAAKLAQSATA